MNGVSKDKIKAAALDYAKGDKALAKAFEAGFKACQSLAMVSRAKMPDKFDRRKKLTEEDIKEIFRLREEGWTYSALASKFGVSIFCPQYWCKHSEIKAYHRKWEKEKYDSLDEKAKRSLLDMRRASTKKTLKYKKKLAMQGAI